MINVENHQNHGSVTGRVKSLNIQLKEKTTGKSSKAVGTNIKGVSRNSPSKLDNTVDTELYPESDASPTAFGLRKSNSVTPTPQLTVSQSPLAIQMQRKTSVVTKTRSQRPYRKRMLVCEQVAQPSGKSQLGGKGVGSLRVAKMGVKGRTLGSSRNDDLVND